MINQQNNKIIEQFLSKNLKGDFFNLDNLTILNNFLSNIKNNITKIEFESKGGFIEGKSNLIPTDTINIFFNKDIKKITIKDLIDFDKENKLNKEQEKYLNKTVKIKIDNNNFIIGTIKDINKNKVIIKPLKGKILNLSIKDFKKATLNNNIKIYQNTKEGHKEFCNDANTLRKKLKEDINFN